MSKASQKVFVVKQSVDEDLQFLMPLLFPSYSRLIVGERTPKQFVAKLEEQVGELRNSTRFQHVLADKPKVQTIEIELVPPEVQQKELQWLVPVKLPFHIVVWSHQKEATIVYVPALNIEVLINKKKTADFEELVGKEIQNCLYRGRYLDSFSKLIEFSRYGSPELESIDCKYELMSPRDEELSKREKKDENETLKKVADRMEDRKHLPTHCVDEELAKLKEILFDNLPQSVLLVGPSGVGKSSLIRELATDKKNRGLLGVEFWETTGSRIVAGMSGYGQWQERCEKLVAELRPKKAVLHLGNLFELIHVGKSVSQDQGIASFLRSFIERGVIRVTAEILPEHIALIEKEDPQLLQAFQRLEINVPSEAKTIRILKKECKARRKREKIEFESDAIEHLLQVHRRYATYSALPGRPISFLRKMIDDATPNGTISTEDVISRFADETGLPFFLLSQKIPLRIEESTQWFSERVVGQSEAVDLVVDMLAAVKANLTPQGKPIASFLFIGPTGVGKTEMAKSIANFMFGDSQKMIRFDMSEYSNPLSVERLIGGTGESEGLLTSKVRQSPFTLLLFDEFEKAHPAFFDLLLQILGEGRLTDAQGRTTDFSTTIIVMTSNLGAESLKEQSFGFGGTDSDADRSKSHFNKELQNFIRPELYNRIDRIVPFAPLSADTVEKVTRRELEKLHKREGIWFRPVTLKIGDKAVKFVAEKGMDPRYGARPIQRFIQDHLVVPVATKLNRHTGELEINGEVTVKDDSLNIDIVANHEESQKNKDKQVFTVTAAIESIRTQRRRSQSLANCSLANRVRNEMFRLKQQLQRYVKYKKKLIKRGLSPSELEVLEKQQWEKESELERYRLVVQQVDQVAQMAVDRERNALSDFYSEKSADAIELNDIAYDIKKSVNRSLFELFVFDSNDNEMVYVAIYSREFEVLKQLVDAYTFVGENREYKSRLFVLKKYQKDALGVYCRLARELDGEEKLELETAAENGNAKNKIFAAAESAVANAFLIEPQDFCDEPDLLGVVISFTGRASFPIFANEKGIHHFRNPYFDPVLVQVFGTKLAEHKLPWEFKNQSKFERDDKRRTYNLENKTIIDELRGTRPFTSLATEMSIILEEAFQHHLDNVIESWN